MVVLKKVVPLPPPPTSNTLTATERACLRRSTTKLARILGVIPRVLDVDNSDGRHHSQHSLVTSTAGPVFLYNQSPIESPVDICSKEQCASSTFMPSDFHSNEHCRSKGTLLVESGELNLEMKNDPIHRLPLICVSRPQHVCKPTHTSLDPYSSSELADSDDDDVESCSSALDTPENVNSQRRKKMERLHRIFGAKPPVSIVFPKGTSDDSGYDSDNSHRQISVTKKRPSLTIRTPCHSSSLPTPVKLETDQSPLSAGRASSPSPFAKPGLISDRDFSAISSPIQHKVSFKGSSPRRPHYRPRSSLCLPGDGEGMQPGSHMKQIDNPVLGGLDIPSLRTFSESPKGTDGLYRIPVVDEAGEEKVRAHAQESLLSSPTIHSPVRSEWYLSDDGAHTEETFVEKDAHTVLCVRQAAPKRVWSHKRKPPPVYEP